MRDMADVDYRESDVKYLRALIENPDRVYTAVEVAEFAGVTQQAAHTHLGKMHERGLVGRKEVGSRAVVWWETSDGVKAYKDSEGGN